MTTQPDPRTFTITVTETVETRYEIGLDTAMELFPDVRWDKPIEGVSHAAEIESALTSADALDDRLEDLIVYLAVTERQWTAEEL